MCGRESERADGFASSRDHQRRCRGNSDAKRASPEPRLAEFCEVVPCQKQNPPLDQRAGTRRSKGNGEKAARKRSAALRAQLEENSGSGSAEICFRPRTIKD